MCSRCRALLCSVSPALYMYSHTDASQNNTLAYTVIQICIGRVEYYYAVSVLACIYTTVILTPHRTTLYIAYTVIHIHCGALTVKRQCHFLVLTLLYYFHETKHIWTTHSCARIIAKWFRFRLENSDSAVS